MGINEAFEKKRWEILDRTNVYLRQILEHLKKQHSLNIHDVNVTSVLITQSIFGVITYWLMTFKTITNFIKENYKVADNKVIFIGSSKGGEAAILL